VSAFRVMSQLETVAQVDQAVPLLHFSGKILIT
jgi:hypothetical protein